ncbi:MAG: hypothetical protein JO063_01685 [Pseudonocardiales bacterium]|nr:hypothetical protein [Pseudonocardiales bacterium]MBV9032063.1 hypothetical protein [Pseudonocardiales bacterium]MBW0008826.1 hypothetical protein [Pseudonocardiales bacterium]
MDNKSEFTRLEFSVLLEFFEAEGRFPEYAVEGAAESGARDVPPGRSE